MKTIIILGIAAMFLDDLMLTTTIIIIIIMFRNVIIQTVEVTMFSKRHVHEEIIRQARKKMHQLTITKCRETLCCLDPKHASTVEATSCNSALSVSKSCQAKQFTPTCYLGFRAD